MIEGKSCNYVIIDDIIEDTLASEEQRISLQKWYDMQLPFNLNNVASCRISHEELELL